MVKSKKKTKGPVWLRLCGYRVVALKAELGEHAIELERAVQEGILVYPDLARADFYDVVLDEGWAYIHVYPEGHAVYLVAHSLSALTSFSTDGSVKSRHAPKNSDRTRPFAGGFGEGASLS